MNPSISRIGRLVVATALLVTAWSWVQLPPTSGLALRVGCSVTEAQRTTVGSEVVLDVHVDDCRDGGGDLLTSDAATDRLMQAVWQTLELPVDAVRVEVTGTGVDTTTILTRAELTERFGAGPSGVVWPVSDRRDESLWLLLPLGYLAAGLGMLLVVRRMRRAGVVVLLLRRR